MKLSGNFKPLLWGLMLAFVGLAGCAASNDGQGVYRVQSVGNAQRSMEVVLTAKPVLIVRANSGAGANAGGLAGGVLQP